MDLLGPLLSILLLLLPSLWRRQRETRWEITLLAKSECVRGREMARERDADRQRQNYMQASSQCVLHRSIALSLTYLTHHTYRLQTYHPSIFLPPIFLPTSQRGNNAHQSQGQKQWKPTLTRSLALAHKPRVQEPKGNRRTEPPKGQKTKSESCSLHFTTLGSSMSFGCVLVLLHMAHPHTMPTHPLAPPPLPPPPDKAPGPVCHDGWDL
ncbi:hypothetical protein JOL62DRAFT_191870 [Phyllosticta paracitricarpa]|uniref:Uncharacterized protein n=1 Tax=Phyllosticta paracitricarpa TaxID=2016321 RepID=A0ABR1N1S5_9PEZI